MPLTLSSRQVFLGLVLFALVSWAFARFFLEAHLGLAPCPLCVTQRLFVWLWAAFAFIGFLHNPQGWGRTVYAALCGLSAWVGALVSARHIWLQNLPEDQVPACGPPLDYLLENFPLRDAINTMLMGDGNCADTVWTFLGLSIPEQTLLVFCVAMLVSLWQALRKSA